MLVRLKIVKYFVVPARTEGEAAVLFTDAEKEGGLPAGCLPQGSGIEEAKRIEVRDLTDSTMRHFEVPKAEADLEFFLGEIINWLDHIKKNSGGNDRAVSECLHGLVEGGEFLGRLAVDCRKAMGAIAGISGIQVHPRPASKNRLHPVYFDLLRGLAALAEQKWGGTSSAALFGYLPALQGLRAELIETQGLGK